MLGGFLFWRRNPFLASSMVPILATLVGGRFTATGPQGATVFDAAAQEVSGRLGAMGTLKIRVRGTKFAIVGRGSLGGLEGSPSDAQRHQLRQFLADHPEAAAAQRGPAGVIDAVANGSAAARMRMWRDALTAAGATVS